MIADPFSLKGQTAVVVGGASGIGRAVAIACGRQGAHVVCLDANEQGARDLVAAASADGIAMDAGALDIRDAAAVDRSFDEVEARHGLDVVICTPGINVRKPILRYTDDDLQRVLAVNVTGNFNVLRAAGRIMTARRKGSIILFSSIRSQVVEPGQSVYAATKAGILQMVKAAATEFGPYNVRVNAIGPGVIETPLTQPIKANADWYNAYAAKSVLHRWGRPDEVAAPTVFLASDAASYITGTILYVDGGWLAADGRFTPPGM